MSSSAPSDPKLPSPTLSAARQFDRLAGLSDSARRLLQEATAALGRRDAAATQRLLAAVQALAPKHPEVLRLGAAIAQLQGQRGEAIDLLRRALAARPQDALTLNNLAHALAEDGDIGGAIQALRSGCELEPERAAPWLVLARMLERNHDANGALEALDEALQREPTHQAGRLAKARMLHFTGRIEAATAEYRSVLSEAPQAAMAWFGLSTLRSARFSAEDLTAIEGVYARTDLADSARAAAGFTLAKALEDQQRHGDAFAILCQANAGWRRRLHWDSAKFSLHTRAIESAFAEPLAAGAPAQQGFGIVFLVGMPRSGSSVIEQILAAHAEVSGGGELEYVNEIIRSESERCGSDFPFWVAQASAADWTRLGQAYLDRIADKRGAHTAFTDKSLMNWRYVGALRAMLPGARFLDCRRDPVETCLACFRQMFMQELGFTYDLSELAAFWHDYERSMRQAHLTHPGAILEVEHERLVADPETQIRRLLEFCDLPFDPSCLRFHETRRNVQTTSASQVREPLRADTARAHLYGRHLDALRALLAERGD